MSTYLFCCDFPKFITKTMNFQANPCTTALTSVATCVVRSGNCWSPVSTYLAPASPGTLGGGTTLRSDLTAPTTATPTLATVTLYPSHPPGVPLTTCETATSPPSSALISGPTTLSDLFVSIACFGCCLHEQLLSLDF